MKRTLTLFLAAVAFTSAFAPPADAQVAVHDLSWLDRATYVIIPQTRSMSLRPSVAQGVEVTGVDVRIAILERTATTTMQITVSNPGPVPAEAVMLLPVPDGSAISAFLFEGSAAEPTAELLRREDARRTYDSIVAKIKDPALLEFAGFNLIRSSVFPVSAGGTQKIRLTYEHLLESDGDRADYLLPRSESLSMRLPWRIHAEVKSKHPISMVYSPSHDVKSVRRSPHHLSLDVTEQSAASPGSFRLSILEERKGFSASLLAYPDPSVGGGYFLLMAGAPLSAAAEADRLTREVTLVLDRSGSMAGEKLDQAKAAALQVIEGLADGEAFNIIDYSSAVSMFAKAPVGKNRETTLEARKYLASIRPNGGTNIHDALLEALRQPKTDGALAMVLFLTDGLPTIGKTSEVVIRDLALKANPHGRRVFTFGVGADVNVPLLDRIADRSRAVATYILPGEDVELQVARVFKRLYGPALSDLALTTLDGEGAETTRRVGELIPTDLPDLFDGDELIVLGQYKDEEPLTFQLSGNFLGKRKSFRFAFDLDHATTRNAFVSRLWASRRIAFLIDEIRQAGAVAGATPWVAGATESSDPRYKELVDEILRLSTEFGILTEYTAFLAREGTDLSDWNGLLIGCDSNLTNRAVYTRAGIGALNQGLNFNKSKIQKTLNYDNAFMDQNLARVEITAVQQVCDRAFFNQSGRWIDSRLVGNETELEPETVIDIGTEAHRALLTELLRQNREGVLSLSGEIILKHGGQTVLVKNGNH